jgi:hypothetical protein
MQISLYLLHCLLASLSYQNQFLFFFLFNANIFVPTPLPFLCFF